MRPAVLALVPYSNQARWSESATNALPFKQRKLRPSAARARADQKLVTTGQEGEGMARKRELIDTGTDKRYVRRNKLGTSFVESDDVGRSLAADRRKRAKRKVESGEGDKGDRPRPKTKRKAAKKKTAIRKGAA